MFEVVNRTVTEEEAKILIAIFVFCAIKVTTTVLFAMVDH